MMMMMIDYLDPALVLLLLIATACATGAHVLWGRSWLQIPVFWLAAAVGCLLAYVIGWSSPLDLPTPAGIPVLEAVIAAWLVIIIASRLRV
jgi:hypothetical protein